MIPQCAAVISLLNFAVGMSCRLDSSLHGTFLKQSHFAQNEVTDSTIREPILYDEISIAVTSISDYGECYEKIGDSYVFGLKRMGKPICFRCVTIIVKSPNILQLAQQQEDICYETTHNARSTCFDPALVSLLDGLLIFRSEYVAPISCGVDGRFNMGYALNSATQRCATEEGSEGNNCELSSRLELKFRNCSFPDFDMALKCVGMWQERDGASYIIVENEENDEFRCGLVLKSPDEISINFSNDSSCSQLTVTSAFERYIFKSAKSLRPFSPCHFPKWLRGDFETLTVTANVLQYNQIESDTVPVDSYCVHVSNDRILVYSETKCGEPLGYHCLWFTARSESLLEFKTTSPQESSNTSVCNDENEFSQSPWTAAVVRQEASSQCGILGRYRTPSELRVDDCYNVTVDCTDASSLQITAYHCTSGVIFDSRTYSCLASWKENQFLYLYTKRSHDAHSCFVTQYLAGRLYLSSTGAHCSRDFNFTTNSDKTIVLEEDAPCRNGKSKASRHPGRFRENSSSTTKTFPIESSSTTAVVLTATDAIQTDDGSNRHLEQNVVIDRIDKIWVVLFSLFHCYLL